MTGSALTFPTPSSLGSLDNYIQAVNRFPLLTAEQEADYGRRWKERQDVEAARAMVLSHLRLVVAVSRNYVGYGLPQADLIQEGNVGLMKAVHRFDPDRGVRLVSFALHWIRAEMHEYILRNWRLVKVATTKAQRKLFFNLRSMKKRSAALTNTEADAIAEALHVKREEVLEMETRMTGHDLTLDPTPSDDDEHAYSPIAYLTDADDEPATIVEAKQTAERRSEGLTRALSKLDARSRRIIEARWLREENPLTLQELATEYGVSAERIRQIESKAMKQMKGAMAAAA
ncbi:MAG TPA: RNA polymerase sigma factor RpoH [Casimicrobiaceae bacterium]|nr:RNA polymerase sigma factor RpoH [Casimicrobiaceae bacterium]